MQSLGTYKVFVVELDMISPVVIVGGVVA